MEHPFGFDLVDLDVYDRLDRLEKKIFKNQKEYPGTLTQKLLLLKYLGMLGGLNDLCDVDLIKSKFLSVLIGANEDNIRHALSKISGNDLLTKDNKEFLVSIMDNVGLEKITKEIEKDYINSQNKKEKRNKK